MPSMDRLKPRKKKNSWFAQPYVRLANGEEKRVYISAKTRDGVFAKLRELQELENKRIPFSDNDWTVSAYFDYWLYEVQQHSLKESSMDSYRRLIEKHLKPVMGAHKLKSLSVQDVRNGIDTIINNGYDGSVASKSMQVLRTCLKHAMKEELVMRNVATLVDKPKYVPDERIVWTAEQSAFFLEATENHPHYVAYLLLLTYGMRRGEILGLRYSDIDFDNKKIYFRQQYIRLDSGHKMTSLKTVSSNRDVPLDPIIEAAILDHANKKGVEIPPFERKPSLSMSGTIIRSRNNTPIQPRNFLRCFQNLAKRLDLPHLTIHDKRHVAGTGFKDVGMPIKDAQKILGHSKPETTMKIYQHGTLETQRVGISAVTARLRPAH